MPETYESGSASWEEGQWVYRDPFEPPPWSEVITTTLRTQGDYISAYMLRNNPFIQALVRRNVH